MLLMERGLFSSYGVCKVFLELEENGFLKYFRDEGSYLVFGDLCLVLQYRLL